ncbi:MAG: hypothetical protein Kow00124_06030 [Anaerolineae bacterium]
MTTNDQLQTLAANIARWRAKGVGDYWVHVGYMGAELHRFGDHALTFVSGKLWRRHDGLWWEVERGKDFWLFSVPGGFAWARDLINKVAADDDLEPDDLTLVYDEKFGYVKLIRIAVGHRDQLNFTFEVKRFGVGPHPDFAAAGE